MVAREIERVTAQRQPLFLNGHLMGGGASSRAVRRHLKAGLPVAAQSNAARTLHDNLEYVKALGVDITEEPPPDLLLLPFPTSGKERGRIFLRPSV